METLHQYTQRTAPDRTQREWADLLGTSRSYFCEIVNGTKRPGPKLIRQIDKMTGGRVPPTVWYRDCVGGSEASSPVPSEMVAINTPTLRLPTQPVNGNKPAFRGGRHDRPVGDL
jgi:hypothetical protein